MRSLFVTLLAACAADPAPCTEEPCLDAPSEGVQLRTHSGLILQPGEDRELCEVVRIPGAGTRHAGRLELAMSPGSHHLIVAAIEVGSETEAAVREGDVIDCVGPTGFGEHVRILGGSQQAYQDEVLPGGGARSYEGGQLVVFNYHYFNATDAPLSAAAALNLHDVPEASVAHLMGDGAFVNLAIAIAPGESRAFVTDCRFANDVMVHKLSRHTHQWGRDVPVWFAGGPRDGELVYTSPDYETPDHVFDTPVLVRAGEGFRFECRYTNTSDHELVFGVKATDEMCILFSQIYATEGREPPLELCVIDDA
jgi:hypothetical protein